VDEVLLQMKSHPLWDDFEASLLGYRPLVPNYIHSDDNTEEWKYNSAKQEGFDLCLTIFNIGVEK